LATERDAQIRHLVGIGMLAGTARWIEFITFSLLVYESTQSTALTVSLSSIRMAPYLFCGAFFGWLADKVDRQTILCIALTVLTTATLVVANATRIEAPGYAILAMLTALSGLYWVTEFPVRRQLLADAAIGKVIGTLALDSAAASFVRAIGVALGGILLTISDVTVLLIIISILYALSLSMAFSLRRIAEPISPVLPIATSASTTVLRPITMVVAAGGVYNLFCLPVSALLPVIASKELNLPAHWIGLLLATEAFGAAIAAIALRRWQAHLPLWPTYFVAVAAVLIAIIFLSQLLTTASLFIALPLLGAGSAIYVTTQTTLIQKLIPPKVRGRASGLTSTIFGLSIVGFHWAAFLLDNLRISEALLAIGLGGAIALSCILLTNGMLYRWRTRQTIEK
jgi:MFS family permease